MMPRWRSPEVLAQQLGQDRESLDWVRVMSRAERQSLTKNDGLRYTAKGAGGGSLAMMQ